MFGRRILYTDLKEINTEADVLFVLNEIWSDYLVNRQEIDKLYNIYKGKQRILERVKSVRPEICNNIVVNRANEIISFKTGYLMGEPIQYVNRADGSTEAVEQLNEFMFAEDKYTKDKELADWFHICGTSYRMVLPDSEEVDESPFEIYTLDPRYSFVVYSRDLSQQRLMSGTVVVHKDGTEELSLYTKNMYYHGTWNAIDDSAPHALGEVPVVEYPANSARLGAFEIVLPLLDAINTVTSNRIDGIEQFIQALMVFKGVNIESEDFALLRQEGALRVPVDGDVVYLVQELNQLQTQTLIDSLYNDVLTICGMPNRNGGSSTSDTGSAVIMRDGWSSAEARAKDTELMFKKSEKAFLKLAMKFSNELAGTHLKLSDIDIRFTRRNYENIQNKATVLTSMLACEKIHPRLAFEQSGMFIDPEVAYLMSEKYVKEHEVEMLNDLNSFVGEEDVRVHGHDNEEA